MPYPTSSTVTNMQTVDASQYNDLRTDALGGLTNEWTYRLFDTTPNVAAVPGTCTGAGVGTWNDLTAGTLLDPLAFPIDPTVYSGSSISFRVWARSGPGGGDFGTISIYDSTGGTLFNTADTYGTQIQNQTWAWVQTVYIPIPGSAVDLTAKFQAAAGGDFSVVRGEFVLRRVF